MKILRAAILLGSATATSTRLLQAENDTISTDGGMLFTATPTEPADGENDTAISTDEGMLFTAAPIEPADDDNGTAIITDGGMLFTETPTAANGTGDFILDTSTAPPDDANGTAIFTDGGMLFTEAPIETANGTAPFIELDASSTTLAPEPDASLEDTGTTNDSEGSILIYNNGDQNTLDPNEISDNNNIQVTDSSTLFIENNSMSIRGYCDNCLFPNSTIDVSGRSNLIVRGENISVLGSNQSSAINDAGGCAIELFMSRSIIDGSIWLRGGDGSMESGIGGDALGLYSESSAEISGDVIFQGGEGVEPGKAVMVDTGSTAKINSGTFKSAVWVEKGDIDVYGGTFQDVVTMNGDEASATFNGCFTTDEKDMGIVKQVELSGTFFNSTELISINVSLYDGAIVRTKGGSDCGNALITTGNNTLENFTYPPTFMPTTIAEGDDSENNSVPIFSSNTLIVMGLVVGQCLLNLL